MSESLFYTITPAGQLARAATADAALSAVEAAGFAWLDYCQPSHEELTALAGPLGLHALSIEDCLDQNQLPKIEDYPENDFLIFNTFSYSDNTLAVHEVDIFIGHNFLITVSGQDLDSRPVLRDIEHAVALDLQSVRQGPAHLLHIILDQIVDRKFVTVEAIDEQLNNAEEAILADGQAFNPSELLHLRRDLLTIRKSLFHEREILVKICRKDCLFIGEQAIFVYRDIYDHLAKLFELTESSREIVSSLMEMYLSILNNQMAKAANDTNTTVRRLTFITTIFMPLSLLAGIGGMSEWSMMTGPTNWRIAYPAFVLAMVALGVASYFLLRWIEKRGR
jgi:magnesium transporter